MSYFSYLIFARIFILVAVKTVGGEIMKRFIVTLLLSTVIVGVLTYYMPKSFEVYIKDISADATVSIYCRETGVNGIDIGSGKIVQCSVTELSKTLARCKDVDGFSVCFEGTSYDVDRILQLFEIDVTSTYDICGLQIVCGNSSKLKGGVVLDGVTVNLQIAFKDGTVTVGSPLILGSY